MKNENVKKYRLSQVTVVLCLHFAQLCEGARRGAKVQLATAHTVLDAVLIETAEGVGFHFPFSSQMLTELLQAGYTVVAIIPADGAPVYFPFWDEHELAVAQWVLQQVMKKLDGSQA